jgi:hypothetical protein
VILEMGVGSHDLFAWAGLKPLSSQSQPPKLLGLQARATGIRLWGEKTQSGFLPEGPDEETICMCILLRVCIYPQWGWLSRFHGSLP